MPEARGITDDGVCRLRERIAVPRPHPQPPHYRCPDVDAFRHVAEAYGDDNPLWSDAHYAETTRWDTPIAPPHLVGGDTLVGEDEVTELRPDQRGAMAGDPLRGAHAFYSGSFREWWAPLSPRRRITRRNALVAVYDKPSEFAGRAIHEWSAEVFADAGDGANRNPDAGAGGDGGGRPNHATDIDRDTSPDVVRMLGAQYRLMIRTERSESVTRDKYGDVALRPYSDDEIARIDAAYATEPMRRRGAEPRWWEDVHEGQELDPLVKGPLRVTDIICWHVGMGMGLYGVKGLRLGYEQRRRMPRFSRPDDMNVWDVQQRVHWDPEWARAVGNPTSYDYGRMRETWLIHLCTDWMGDDAWLWKLDCRFTRFNYVGDTHWMQGHVTRVYLDRDAGPAVDLDVWGVNQRGEITTPGHATILLPSREQGSVRLPSPPGGARTCQETLDALAARFSTSGSP